MDNTESREHQPSVGHNSQIGGIAAEALCQFIHRIENLEEEIKALNADKSDVYKQAKSQGFDVKIIRALISERRKDPNELDEMKQILELYRAAVGGTIDAPHVRAQVQ